MRVKVYSPDTSEYLGIGEMHREDLEVVDKNGKVAFTLTNHPHIVMPDGKTILGIRCWWEEVKE